MEAGLSTLGVKFGYGVETVAGQKPSLFKALDRINSIGGISGETNTIDASALEDYIERNVAGRQGSGGSFPVKVNATDETDEQWLALIEAYKGLTGGKRMWFEVMHPKKAKAWFIVAQPPQVIPMPEFDQNGLLTVDYNLAIEEYKGQDTKVDISANE